MKGDVFKCKGLLSVMAFVVPYRVTQSTEARKLTHLIYLAPSSFPPRLRDCRANIWLKFSNK